MKLSEIKSPRDIKGLSVAELEALAREIREAILYRSSMVGGHVGPNLGVVEMTLAMHYVFDAPHDKLLYDVSHQDFTHKMLTGRVDGYINAADMSKVGEFTSPIESPEYDLYFGGHTSPMISLACGMSRARELKGDDYKIVLMVGDGSLSGGEAFEGLNTASQTRGNMVIIINDNQMAIAPDCGGMYKALHNLRETNGQGEPNLFKAFALDYMYVAEGNDMRTMIEALQKAAAMDHPVVVHVNTQKGQGYAPAEANREMWHHRDPFDISTGALKQLPPSPSAETVLRSWLLRKCREVEDFLVITSATPGYFDFTAEDRAEVGRHYIDVDIAEQTAASVMAGAARMGAKAVWPAAASFLQRAYDQLMEDWAQNDCPALVVVQKSGIRGFTDETHLGWWDIAEITSIPGVVYLAPTNLQEFEAMMEWAVTQNRRKVCVRQPTYSIELADGPVDTDYSQTGRFKVVRQGEKVAVIGAGDFFVKARQVVDLLAKSGINATLINPRYLCCMDHDLLHSLAQKHSLVATIEDGSLAGGFGGRVAQTLGDSPLRVMNFGLPKQFHDHFDVATLEKECGLMPEQIAEKILKNFC